MTVSRVSRAEGLKLLAKQKRRTSKRFDWADILCRQIQTFGLPQPAREYRPFVARRFRLDLAWTDRMLFVECDGGEYLKASARRHGGAKDCERWNLLTQAGWQGYRFVGSQIKSGHALNFLTDILQRW